MEEDRMSSYTQSAGVKKAKEELEEKLSAKPGVYESKWQQQISSALDAILNRPDFRYDPGSDSLYRQYRDRYVSLGRQAMADTMGKAQSMTGGYGSSYAQTAGQQAYQGYLQGLNDKLPELYQLALQGYEARGQQLKDRLSALQGQESSDYSRYQDTLKGWQTDRDYLAGRYESERDHDFAAYESLRDYAFRQAQAAEEKRQWQQEFDEAKRRYDLEYAAAQAAAAQKGSSSSGGSGKFDNGGVDTESVKAAQRYVGATADGMWGSKSKKAAKAMGFNSLQEVLAALGKTQSTGYNRRPNFPTRGGGIHADTVNLKR